jgi:hypothetical protein
MEEDDSAMKKARHPGKGTRSDRGLPVWPWNRPLPKFRDAAAELAFWHSYDFAPPEDGWEQVNYEPRATVQPREHVYRVRFNDEEMTILQKLAKRRGVTASAIVRDLVHAVARKAG